MIIEHNREKLLNAIIYFLNNTKYCGATKLYKLLYYLDFLHFKETGMSVTSLRYSAWQFGPVPDELYNEISNRNAKPDLVNNISIRSGTNDSVLMKPKRKFDGKYFTKRELRILEKVAVIFKDANANDIVETVHMPNHPWDKTMKEKGFKADINYMLALDNSKESLSIEEALERIVDSEEIKKIFNV